MTGIVEQAMRVVRGCWRLRRVSLDDVRLLAMSDEAFAAQHAQLLEEFTAAEATLAALGKRIEALTRPESLKRRDAVALMLAAVRDDWSSVAEIVRPYGGDWGPLAKSLVAIAITAGGELAGADRFEEFLEELALELAAGPLP